MFRFPPNKRLDGAKCPYCDRTRMPGRAATCGDVGCQGKAAKVAYKRRKDAAKRKKNA